MPKLRLEDDDLEIFDVDAETLEIFNAILPNVENENKIIVEELLNNLLGEVIKKSSKKGNNCTILDAMLLTFKITY